MTCKRANGIIPQPPQIDANLAEYTAKLEQLFHWLLPQYIGTDLDDMIRLSETHDVEVTFTQKPQPAITPEVYEKALEMLISNELKYQGHLVQTHEQHANRRKLVLECAAMQLQGR